MLALFIVVQRGYPTSYDGRIAAAVTGSIVDHHALSIPAALDPLGRNHPYAHYGIGPSLVAVPLYAVAKAVGTPVGSWLSLANPLVLAACGVLLAMTATTLGVPRRWAVVTALVFGGLTMALSASVDLLSEAGVTLGIALLVLGSLRCRDARSSGPWLVSVGVAVAILFRSDSLLLAGVGVLLLPAFVPLRRLMRDPRTLAALVGPGVLALAWTSYYAWLRDRAIWPKVYGGSFSTPLLSGLHFFLFSSGGGFFCYNPVLLLGLVGLWPLWRRDRACTALVLLLVVVRLFFYARWSDPAGGVVWGPRFLLPWTWLLAIPTALVLTAIWSWPRRRLAPALVACGGLAAASAMASWLSVWVPPEETYNHIHYVPPAVPAAARKAYLDRAVLLYYKSWQRGPFALSWADATKPRQLPLEHMRDGPSAVGYLAMLGATLVPAAAVALAGKPARPRLDS